MTTNPNSCQSPKQVIAREPSQSKRSGLTSAGREALRLTAKKNRPWRHSTGPRTAAGKAKVAANGKVRQKGSRSVRELKAELVDVRELITTMAAARRAVQNPAVASQAAAAE